MAAQSITRIHLIPSWSPRLAVARGWAALGVMWRARQTRRLLDEMDSRLLADVGISRGDALMEASRPMWDVTPRSRPRL